MEFANRSWAQAKAAWQAMSPSARTTTAALGALVVVVLLYLGSRQWGAADGYLMGGRTFRAQEITAAQAAFHKAQLTDAVIEGNRIRVPAGQESAYVAAMADGGVLPSDFHDYLEQTLEDVGIWATRSHREELIKNARQKKLSAIISLMPGIDSAYVEYEARKRPGLSGGETVKASVSVKTEPGHELNAQQAKMIRHLVAPSIAASPDDVAVLDLNHDVVVAGAEGQALDQNYLAAVRAHQKSIADDVRKALSYVPGAEVGVTVVLKAEDGSRELAPKRVSVAVAVPQYHFQRVWQKQHAGSDATPPAPSEAALAAVERAETEKIRAHVEQLLQPFAAQGDAAPLVKVTSFVPPALEEPVQADGSPPAWAWSADHAVALSILAAALFVLLLLRTLVRAARRGRKHTPQDPAADGAEGHLQIHGRQGAASLRDELAELVHEDPDKAADIIKGWIGKAS